MSMVTVHGPNTMYTGTPGQGGSGAGLPIASSPVGFTATQSPLNGLIFSFGPSPAGTRPAADFAWSFTGPGSPAAQPATKSGSVTFSGAGAGVLTCVVSNATGGAPANGTYTINVTASAGVPRMVEGQEAAPAAQATENDEEYIEYDPYDHTVAEVMAEANSNPDCDYIAQLIEAERNGKNRTTLINQLQELYESLTAAT